MNYLLRRESTDALKSDNKSRLVFSCNTKLFVASCLPPSLWKASQAKYTVTPKLLVFCCSENREDRCKWVLTTSWEKQRDSTGDANHHATATYRWGEQGAACPALPMALAPDLFPTTSKTWTWEKATIRPFKGIKNGSPKRQLFMYFGTPPSREGYLPTSSAPPVGVSVGGDPRREPPFLQLLLKAPSRYLVTQADPSTGCQLEPHPTPPLLPDAPDTVQPSPNAPLSHRKRLNAFSCRNSTAAQGPRAQLSFSKVEGGRFDL